MGTGASFGIWLRRYAAGGFEDGRVLEKKIGLRPIFFSRPLQELGLGTGACPGIALGTGNWPLTKFLNNVLHLILDSTVQIWSKSANK